ncbi:aldo/keto reductase [Cucumibacter marinus]|uniref:aldo/keto reductase n=1 Tax=Cucumibacter marinus TaxID=1121252 RepID=UPI000412312C|nr:aldo/keto reductase [Cucumibacter marinus]
MRHNLLGRTGITVSEICLGTMTWGRQNSEAEGHEQMDYALDRDINFFDTAEMYAVPTSPETYGRTEEIIGTWFNARQNRDRVVLATKVVGGGMRWVRQGAKIDKANVHAAVDASLKRLKTDYIDLYQIHWPRRGHYHFEGGWDYHPERIDRDVEIPMMLETLEAMGELVDAGKIRAFGVSNESAWGVMHFLKLAEQHGLPRCASIQNEYNLLRREYDHDLAELGHMEDVGLLAYSPLGAGAITGKYLDGALPEGTRGAIIGASYRTSEYSSPPIRAYIDLAKRHGLDISQLAIAFCLTRPFMASVIIGATSMEQLKTDIGAADLTLSDEVLGEIEALHRQYPRTI